MRLIQKVFVEHEIKNNRFTKKILSHLPSVQVTEIDRVDDIFQQVKKPYLQKRKNLALFIGKKRGELVKEAPPAYGLSGEPHYYFIHAYNCIYECQYCYLQGYFHSPDLVFFVNHEEIITEMRKKLHPQQSTWFHAGEFSDSLAMNSITGEWGLYWDFFEEHPSAMLELRTKSVNINPILKLKPLKNAFVSFSLMPELSAKTFDLKAPPLKSRLQAIQRLLQEGYRVGIHLDPIIDHGDTLELYRSMIQQMHQQFTLEQIAYFSLGTVRFTKDVFKEVERNYPTSSLLATSYLSGQDQKKKYFYFHRMKLMREVKEMLIQSNVKEEKIYLCMED